LRNKRRNKLILLAGKKQPRKPSGLSYVLLWVCSMYVKSLFPSSQFTGFQKSDRNSYPVTVEIKYVDVEKSCLSGYLTITGLTKEYNILTTFFEAEIIGEKHHFLTRKWDADESKDRGHWGKFPGFAPYSSCFNNDNFYRNFHENFEKSDYVFMRWKESFLVPNHHVKSIDGASYDGFYYICYQKSTDSITGYYYHRTHNPTDMYQS